MILKRDNRIQADELFVDEAIFATQNRWLGVRGNFEEGVPYQDTIRGTYINGFYDVHTIEYGERAYGFPELAQTIVNVPDAQTITFTVDNKTLDLANASLVDLKRTYDINGGYTLRKAIYELPKHGQFILTFKRITHLKYKALFINEVSIESTKYQGNITITSTLNGNVQNFISKTDPRLAHKHHKKLTDPNVYIDNDYGTMTLSTRRTQLGLLVGITHSEPFNYRHEHGVIIAEKEIALSPNKPYHFRKYAMYHTATEGNVLETRFHNTLNIIQTESYSQLIKSHVLALEDYKNLSSVDIETNDNTVNENIAYSLYQLYTAGAMDETVNVPAKGLTGEGYEGHTFWDTEIYVLPYFMQVSQKTTIDLLMHRYLQIPNAKKEAETLGVNEGVKFAWRTINGDEASAYYPAGTAQYHINSDIAYTIIKYYQLYKDNEFMEKYGFELLLETARFFKHVVHKHEGLYHLHHVTGPDEYTAVVDNNYYTNSLLKYHLTFLVDYIKKHSIEIPEEELALFKDIRDHIVLLYDESLNIDVQDQSFLSKKPWDFNATRSDQRPLLLHFHPLTLYRHQVLKQPDTVLSHLLLANRPTSVQEASFNYYEKLMSHDSSLSYCIHATQAARLGKIDSAYAYFKKIVALDIDNIHGNTQFGLHLANLGGVYLALLRGFIGYDIDEFGVSISPKLPDEWITLNMPIRLNKNTMVKLEISHHKVVCTASNDSKLKVYEDVFELTKDVPKTILI